MESAALLGAIRREAEALITAAEPDMGAQVRSCPGWSVGTVVSHIGRVHRWATGIVAAAGDPPPGFPPRPDTPVDRAWFHDGVGALCTELESAGPDRPVWTFLGPGQTRFWFRRQALETAVHRWDVEDARSHAAPIETELALAGIDEIFDMHLPRRLAGADPPALPASSLHLHATDDAHGEWIIAGDDQGALLVGHGHERADVALRASASELLLWSWGRRPIDGLEILGDRAAAAAWAAVMADL